MREKKLEQNPQKILGPSREKYVYRRRLVRVPVGTGVLRRVLRGSPSACALLMLRRVWISVVH